MTHFRFLRNKQLNVNPKTYACHFGEMRRLGELRRKKKHAGGGNRQQTVCLVLREDEHEGGRKEKKGLEPNE